MISDLKVAFQLESYAMRHGHFTFFGLFLNFLDLSASPKVKSATTALDRSLNGAWIGPEKCRCGLGFRLAPKRKK